MTNPSIKALREALEAGPTPGPWERDEDFAKSFLGTVCRVGGFIVGPRGRFEGGEYDDHSDDAIDAAFIAAANPEAIRTLLALVDAQEADAARLAWWFSNESKPVNFVNTYLEGMRSDWNLDQWRAAIDSAMRAQK